MLNYLANTTRLSASDLLQCRYSESIPRNSGGFQRQASDEGVHLAKHVYFIGAKDVVIRMCQPNNPRGRPSLFKRFRLCSLKCEITGVSLSALSRISYPTLVRKSVNSENGNVDPGVFCRPARMASWTVVISRCG
jgi:hypothetical protein